MAHRGGSVGWWRLPSVSSPPRPDVRSYAGHVDIFEAKRRLLGVRSTREEFDEWRTSVPIRERDARSTVGVGGSGNRVHRGALVLV